MEEFWSIVAIAVGIISIAVAIVSQQGRRNKQFRMMPFCLLEPRLWFLALYSMMIVQWDTHLLEYCCRLLAQLED